MNKFLRILVSSNYVEGRKQRVAAAKTTTIYLTESEVAVTFELETFATSTAVTA